MIEVILNVDPKLIGRRAFMDLAQKALSDLIKEKTKSYPSKGDAHDWMVYTRTILQKGGGVIHLHWVGGTKDGSKSKVMGGLFNKKYFHFAYKTTYNQREASVQSIDWGELVDTLYEEIKGDFLT